MKVHGGLFQPLDWYVRAGIYISSMFIMLTFNWYVATSFGFSVVGNLKFLRNIWVRMHVLDSIGTQHKKYLYLYLCLYDKLELSCRRRFKFWSTWFTYYVFVLYFTHFTQTGTQFAPLSSCFLTGLCDLCWLSSSDRRNHRYTI